MYSKDYLKAKAESVWKAYDEFKEELYELGAKAEAAGIEGAEELDLADVFINVNEELGTVLEKVFGITCFD